MITFILSFRFHLSILVFNFKPTSYQAVKNETSGNFGHALRTIIQCAHNPAKYFTKVFLYMYCLSKHGINDFTFLYKKYVYSYFCHHAGVV